jgi:hypothetical protein
MRGSMMSVGVTILSTVLGLATVACGGQATVGTSEQAASGAADAGPSPWPDALSGAAGALADAGAAAPVNGYPAVHPAMPHLVNNGGPVIASPKVVAVTFAGDPYQATIDELAATFGDTAFWTANVHEYGVGHLAAKAPVHLALKAPTLIDDAAIQAWLKGRLDGTHAEWGTADESTIYTIYYPAGTSVTLAGFKSCSVFGGYHSEVKIGAKTVPYAVMPRCASFLDLHGFDVLSVATSHELIEAVTDPRPYTAPTFSNPDDDHAIWGWYTGGESGDLCTFNDGAFYTPSDYDFLVQRSWSNAAAAAGHDPCVPALPGRTYFNTAPVMPDAVKANGATTRGVKIPVGESRTLELDLYSDGPTDAWSVSAVDLSALEGGKQVLSFSFDKTKGQNGDKLHVTIKVLGVDPQYGGEGFAIFSELKGQRNVWYGFVGN